MTGNRWNDAAETNEQYSLAKILGIWAAATLPMFILAWVAFPALAPEEEDLLGRGTLKMAQMAVGLFWDFVLAMIIVYREEGDLRWGTLQRRLRLNTPRDPKTGEPRRKLWLWLIPVVLLHTVAAFQILPLVDQWVYTDLLPFLAPPPGYDLGPFLTSPEAGPLFLGNWGILAVFLLMITFNILGDVYQRSEMPISYAKLSQNVHDGFHRYNSLPHLLSPIHKLVQALEGLSKLLI